MVALITVTGAWLEKDEGYGEGKVRVRVRLELRDYWRAGGVGIGATIGARGLGLLGVYEARGARMLVD